MPQPKDIKLYATVKKLADEKFSSKSGIYKSSWIVKEYKKRGGKYIGSKPKQSGLKRWFKEEWVDLNRPIKNSKGKVVGYKPCGRPSSKDTLQSVQRNHKNKYPLCRPSKRVTSNTPRTYREISKRSLSKAKRDKSKVEGKKNIQFGGKSQFRGRPSSVMVKIPENVKKWARYAFKLKKLGFQGAKETGWKRAKQLATKETIPIEDLRYMRNWFARHIFTSYPGFKKWNALGRPKDQQWHNKRAIISWITWGSNAGFRWVNSQKTINLLNKHFNKNYKVIKGK